MKRILIVGGYGLVGSNVARLIRKNYPTVALILAGRNPGNGQALAEELNHAQTAYINLKEKIDWTLYGKLDIIITAMEDHTNVLREAAILKGIAQITITEIAEEISPTIFLSLHKTPTAPIVLASHWQAGIITLVARQIAKRFSKIDRIDTVGLYDDLDPIGPLVASQVDGFIANALLRQNRKWKIVNAKENARTIHLQDGSPVIGYPMSTLDVPSIAAFTDTPTIRFDFAIGTSIGTHNGAQASHDLYIDMQGVLLSGEAANLRTIISGPKGQSHLTAVGVFLIVEAILGKDNLSTVKKGGIFLPETIIDTDTICNRLQEFGISVTEELDLI